MSREGGALTEVGRALCWLDDSPLLAWGARHATGTGIRRCALHYLEREIKGEEKRTEEEQKRVPVPDERQVRGQRTLAEDRSPPPSGAEPGGLGRLPGEYYQEPGPLK